MHPTFKQIRNDVVVCDTCCAGDTGALVDRPDGAGAVTDRPERRVMAMRMGHRSASVERARVLPSAGRITASARRAGAGGH